MLIFRYAPVILVSLFSLGLGLYLFLHFACWVAFLPFLFFLGLVIYGSFQIASGFFLPARCNGPKHGIALTFDDGPDPEWTPTILDVLEKHQVKAAFFCIGKRAEAYPELVRQIFDRGHIVANHSYEHPLHFGFLSEEKVKQELNQTNQILNGILGKMPRLFRPPAGITNPVIARAVRTLGLETIGWSCRSLDTVTSSPEKLLHRLQTKIRPGQIVLFHDTKQVTALVLERFLIFARDSGLPVLPLDEFLQLSAYEQN